MIRRALFPLVAITLLLLAACAPQLRPVAVREGDNVHITVTASAPMYDISLHALNATTEDVRCATLNVTDVACLLGDLAEGESVVVTVTGEPGEVECIAFAFSDPELGLTSYRPYACIVGGA